MPFFIVNFQRVVTLSNVDCISYSPFNQMNDVHPEENYSKLIRLGSPIRPPIINCIKSVSLWFLSGEFMLQAIIKVRIL